MRGKDTDDISSHRLPGADIWVGLSGMHLHGTLREGSGLLSMQPIGCSSLCSTDAVLLLLLLSYHRRLRTTLRSARAARRRRMGSTQ